jgi:hypothetical protein
MVMVILWRRPGANSYTMIFWFPKSHIALTQNVHRFRVEHYCSFYIQCSYVKISHDCLRARIHLIHQKQTRTFLSKSRKQWLLLLGQIIPPTVLWTSVFLYILFCPRVTNVVPLCK